MHGAKLQSVTLFPDYCVTAFLKNLLTQLEIAHLRQIGKDEQLKTKP